MEPVTDQVLPPIGPYRLEHVIGAGGMGTVWLARHELLGHLVALKQVPIDSDPGVRDRTVREGRFAIELHNHPSVVDVIDVLEDDRNVWLVMEYVASLTLGDLIAQRGALDPGEVAWIGAQVADALAAGHAQGIVHRDVKPHNVLVARDGKRVKLSDFGIARRRADPRSTTVGSIIGTLSYMAPEVARGGEPTEASDVFGLGATLFHAVEGTGPYGADLVMERLYPRVCNGQLDELVRAGELPRLQDLLHRMLQLVADSRQDTELAADTLHELGTGGLTAATLGVLETYVPPRPDRTPPLSGSVRRPVTPPPPPEPTGATPASPPRPRRWRAIAAAGAAAAVLAGAIVVATADPFGWRPTVAGVPVASSASPFEGLPALAGVRLPGGPRTADPCPLLDHAGLGAAVPTPGTQVSACDTALGDIDVSVSLQLPQTSTSVQPSRRRPDTQLGAALVVSPTGRSSETTFCETEIQFSAVTVAVQARRTSRLRDTAPVCDAADRAARLAIERLAVMGIPENPQRATAPGLITVDACGLVDDPAVAAVPGLAAQTRGRTFGSWSCYVGTQKSAQPSVVIQLQLSAPQPTSTLQIGGRNGRVYKTTGTFNTRGCIASFEYRAVSALAVTRAERVVVTVDEVGGVDACAAARAIGEGASKRLPPAT